MNYTAASPASSGEYALVLTPADYFGKDIGGANGAMTVPVEVSDQEDTDSRPRTISSKRPRSESHVLPEEFVKEAVTRAGGRLVAVDSQQKGLGGACISHYYATR